MLTDGIFIDEYNMKETIIEEIVDKQGMYSLAGPHGIGKTYLAKQIGEEIEKEKGKYKDTVWAYVCMTQEYKHTIKNIFDPFIRALDSTVRADVRKEMASKRSITESGACILDKLQKHVVLVLDEFQNIEEQPQLMESLYQWYKTKKLSILFIARPRVSVLWENIKHRDGLGNKIEKNWVDGIINIGKCYMVPGFSKNAREEYLKACIANSKKSIVISEDAKKVIYYYAGGHPHTLYDIMNATEKNIRIKRDGEKLRANDVIVPFINPLEKDDCKRFNEILEQMQSIQNGEKNAKYLFLETFENSGLDKATRLIYAMWLYDQGYLVKVEEETCCKLLGLDETPGENESVLIKSIRSAMKTYKNYITVEGYEPMSPYFLVYSGELYKERCKVEEKLMRLEDSLREFFLENMKLRYGTLEWVTKMQDAMFPNKEFYMDSAEAEASVASDCVQSLDNPLEVLSFGDYFKIMEKYWEKPFFTHISNSDCKHMFSAWTNVDIEKVKRWGDLSESDREKYRRVSFARARNAKAHKNRALEEFFTTKQLQQLKEDIEAVQWALDSGALLKKPFITGYEKYCLVGRSFLFEPASLQPDAAGVLDGSLSKLTYKAYLKDEEYREDEGATVVCWDVNKNAFKVSYQTPVIASYGSISDIPYDSNHRGYPDFNDPVSFWLNKIDTDNRIWKGFIVSNVEDAANRKYYPANMSMNIVDRERLIMPMNEGAEKDVQNRKKLDVEGRPYRVKVQKTTNKNNYVSYEVTDIVYGE